ncbi:hypothetical protein QBC39DRAFT_369794 [Podospora conica]|nr:hypothetical protein QBC39DRAFT_369794 [Schizothecium conicum]
MCRQYQHCVWRCTKKYDCPGYSEDKSLSGILPSRPRIVACKAAIERARVCAAVIADIDIKPENPIFELPCADIPETIVGSQSFFALVCPGVLETIEGPEEDESNAVVLGIYCPYHRTQVTVEMNALWARGTMDALNSNIRIYVLEGLMHFHIDMYCREIKFVVSLYARLLTERAAATGEGEVFRPVRKLQTYLFRQLMEKEIPTIFGCDICADHTLPSSDCLLKARKIRRLKWGLRMEILQDATDIGVVGDQYRVEGFHPDDSHEGWIYYQGKFLFPLEDTWTPDPKPGSGADRFSKSMHIKTRFMDEVQAMIGPSHMARRRANLKSDYQNVRLTDNSPHSDLFYNSSDSDSTDSDDESPSEISARALAPKPTHFSVELRKMINPT